MIRSGARAAATMAIALCLAATSCGTAREKRAAPPERAFYYWRTTFELTAVEQRALSELGATRLYLRLFDIDATDGDAAPGLVAPLTLAAGHRLPAGVDIVPVVFVRNDVFRRLGPGGPAALAETVRAEVVRRAVRLGFSPRELQIDCDWTETTREPFFRFASELGAALHRDRISLSATIRLHQVKYRERTGIPPVDRGMLMFYNMGRLGGRPDDRAIFDPAAAARYLSRIADYPLPLDVALPIWSWVLHLRDGRVHDLLQSTGRDELAAAPFLVPVGPDRYRATRTAFLRGSLLREGDLLKVEAIGPTESLAAARLVASRLPGHARTVSLFDLSERNVTRHGTAELEQVFAAVR